MCDPPFEMPGSSDAEMFEYQLTEAEREIAWCWAEIERLQKRVAELETPTCYWDDRDLTSAVEPEDVGAYDDVGDVLPFRAIHELPTRWALVTDDGVKWFDSEEAANAKEAKHD